MTQVIYFDIEDAEMDGNGWNIISDIEDTVALRFSSLFMAKMWCEQNNHEYTIDKGR
jgi:hypothetical protein